MAKLNFPSFGDLVAFSNTFAPGGTFTGRQPSYAFDNTGDEVIYQRSQTLASTGYFNINPRVTLTGNDLSTNNRGELSGEITQLVFSSENRGFIARISDVSINGRDFTNILLNRIGCDRFAGTDFNSLLGDAIETYSFGSGDDTTTIRGFLGALQRLDMGGGDDRLTLRSPRDDSFIASGGDGVDTLHIEVFSSQETTTVDLAVGEVRIGDFSVQFHDFEIFEGSPGPYSFIGSDQADIIFAAGLDDTISAGAGDDSLFAGFGDDIINAGDGDDTINAGTANDLVFAGAGDDLIFGDGGDDTLHGEAGSDVINGGDGMDQAVFEDGLDAFSFFRAGDVLLVRHDATGDIDAVRADVEVLSFMSEIASHADLLLQASFSPLSGSPAFPTNDGDVLRGDAGADLLMGLRGADRLVGKGGDDQLIGAAGKDTLIGGRGRDSLEGGGAKDILKGGGSRDELDGGGGRDLIFGGGGADIILPSNGADHFFGGGGRDVFQFFRNSGRDVIGDFQQGRDKIEVSSSFVDFEDVRISQVGNDVRIRIDKTTVIVEDDRADNFTLADFIF